MPYRERTCLQLLFTGSRLTKKIVTKDQIENEYPFKNLPDGYEGIYAPDNGIINVQLMLRTLSRLAKDYGAHARQHIEVTKLVPLKEHGEDIWRVDALSHGSEKVAFRGRKIIVTAGAYTNHVLKPSFGLKLKLDIWEMVASYFSVNAGPKGTVFPSRCYRDNINGNR